jgi:hypothetical protein
MYSNKKYSNRLVTLFGVENLVLKLQYDKCDSLLITLSPTLYTRCSSALLCSHYEENSIIMGGYDKKIYHIDPRSASVVNTIRIHKKPVLCMAADDKYLITGRAL